MRRIPRAAVPNAVTALCLLCGYLSLVNTLHGQFQHAAYFSLYAGFLDLLDGSLAKLLNASSITGGIFDSLSDLVTFGVAPALLVSQVYFAGWGTPGMLIGAVFVLAAAARLARFTAGQVAGSSTFFAGMPTPLAMGLLSGYVVFCQALGGRPGPSWVAAILCLGAAALMVSAIPYERSMQFAARRVPRAWKRAAFVLFILSVLAMPSISFFAWAALLAGGGLIRSAVLAARRMHSR